MRRMHNSGAGSVSGVLRDIIGRTRAGPDCHWHGYLDYSMCVLFSFSGEKRHEK